MKVNINNQVTVYPTTEGWKYLKMRLFHLYSHERFSRQQLEEFWKNKLTKDDGFKEQLWVLASDYPKLFSCVTNYIKTDIEITLS
jgi:hypothetical protein